MQSIFVLKIFILSLLYTHSSVWSESDRNIAFDSADLTYDYEIDNHLVQLQAFKSINNDLILNTNNASKYSQLQWFSIGYPKLLMVSDNPINVFRFNREGFSLDINMLTSSLKQEFVRKVQKKYKIQISEDQIVNLVPSDFQCSLKFYSNDEKLLIRGRVKQFAVFPLQVHFDTPSGTRERDALLKRIEADCKHLDLNFDCYIGSHGRITKVNTLSINAEQINQLSLVDDLFGPASSVYVTRQQMAELASKVYTRLNIIEDYQIPQSTFSTDFIQDFLAQTSNLIDKYEPLEQVLAAVSPYNFKGDLKADTVKQEYEKLLTIASNASKQYIKLDNEHYEHLKQKSSESFSGSLSGSGWGFSASASANYAKERESDWAKSGRNIDDQLRELNNYDQNEIEWKFDGEKIIPKSIKVSRLLRSKFDKGIKLNRIRREYYNNKFNQSIVLSTLNAYLNYDTSYILEEKLKEIQNDHESLKKQFHEIKKQRYPYGSIVAISLTRVLNKFDSSGKGFGDYLGWFLCDGRNNAPNLNGRFLVGFDTKTNDYGELGKLGGLDYVTLTIGQLPRHNHDDLGHNHEINILSSEGGTHNHFYKDFFFSNNNHRPDIDHAHVPYALGLSGAGQDHDNVGYQAGRHTYDSGSHSHNINGKSNNDSAKISYVGSNEKVENRPPYFVVAYIIYLGIV